MAALGHNNWQRLLRRALEEMHATAQIAKYTTLRGAVHTFFVKAEIQVMNRRGYYETPAATKRLLKKHAVMREYFDKTYEPFLNTYNLDTELPEPDLKLREPIWICWWQGLDQAPDIVKKCADSIRKYAGGHELVVITEENYREYVQIPRWLEEKYKAGVISRTHFSDVLRLSLLAQYGGMWLDATVFCGRAGLDEYFSLPVWTVKRPGYGHISAGCGGFVTSMMRCSYECRWICVTFRDFLLHYWSKEDFLVDYLMLDYMIDLAQRNDPRIKACFDGIAPNNPQCEDLIKVLDQPYDEALWKEMKKDTSLFKLSWKQSFAMERDGKETFYAKLIRGEL